MSYHVSGPCTVTFDGEKLGTSKNGITIRPVVNWLPVIADDFGEAPGAFIFGGKACQVDMVLTEYDTVATTGIGEILRVWFPNGLYGCLTGDADNDPCPVGQLVKSTLCKSLSITESTKILASNGVWTATYAFMPDPSELLLAATSEQNVPLSFIILPDGSSDLFTTVPSYMTTGA